MTGLAWQLARHGGWPRMVLIGVCTALAAGLLLVGTALLDLPAQPREQLSNLAADPGVRGGTAVGAALLTLPILLLLLQAVRLGTATRERSLAALRLAGASPGQVRALGALEVGIPALLGGIGGLGVFWVLRLLLGGVGYEHPDTMPSSFSLSANLRVVPTSVSPTWWQVLLIVAAVGALGTGAGLLGSRGLTLTPLGVSRRVPDRPPRPWGLLLLVAAVALAPVLFVVTGPAIVLGSTIVLLAVLGTASLAPWTAFVVGRRVRRRSTSGVTLLAASRIEAEPRPVGRAAGAVGSLALVSGYCGSLAGILVTYEHVDYTYWGPLLLVAVLLLGALAMAAWSMAVHTVESLLDRRRSTAALAAGGMSLVELERCQRLECGLVAVPLAAASCVVGTLVLAVLSGGLSLLGLLVMLAVVILTPALVWLAILLAVRLVRPWTVRATAAENLRTE